MKASQPVPIDIDSRMLADALVAAHQAADAAAITTLASFRQPLAVDNKAPAGEFDPVTEADREAEAIIRKTLLAAFPEHGFLGEESGTLARPDQPIWVIDPIDGTRAYITGMPLWGTLIALSNGVEPVLGMLDQPFLKERYIGLPDYAELHTRGKVQRLQTRVNRPLHQAVLQTTTPDMFKSAAAQQAFSRVSRRVALTRYGGDCYSYALLTMGLVDLVIECDLQPYDVQAIIPIVRGAGGIFTDWQGGSAADGGCVVAAGSAELHAEALAILGQCE